MVKPSPGRRDGVDGGRHAHRRKATEDPKLSLNVWRWMVHLMRDKCIPSGRLLKPSYSGKRETVGSPLTYGEVTPAFVDSLISQLGLTENDVFVDIGSGVGNVVLQVAAQVGCKAVGVEVREELSSMAEAMRKMAGEMGRKNGMPALESVEKLVQCVTGDARCQMDVISQATVIFINNWTFGVTLETELMSLLFQLHLGAGVRLVTLKNLCPRFHADSPRFHDHPCQMFIYPWRVVKCPCKAPTSWDCKPLTYYIYTVDTMLAIKAKIKLLRSRSHRRLGASFQMAAARRPRGSSSKVYVRRILADGSSSSEEEEEEAVAVIGRRVERGRRKERIGKVEVGARLLWMTDPFARARALVTWRDPLEILAEAGDNSKAKPAGVERPAGSEKEREECGYGDLLMVPQADLRLTYLPGQLPDTVMDDVFVELAEEDFVLTAPRAVLRCPGPDEWVELEQEFATSPYVTVMPAPRFTRQRRRKPVAVITRRAKRKSRLRTAKAQHAVRAKFGLTKSTLESIVYTPQAKRPQQRVPGSQDTSVL